MEHILFLSPFHSVAKIKKPKYSVDADNKAHYEPTNP